MALNFLFPIDFDCLTRANFCVEGVGERAKLSHDDDGGEAGQIFVLRESALIFSCLFIYF